MNLRDQPFHVVLWWTFLALWRIEWFYLFMIVASVGDSPSLILLRWAGITAFFTLLGAIHIKLVPHER